MMKLNIVTVVRNDPPGLAKTCNSVRDLFKLIGHAVSIHHIIIDGASIDTTLEIIDSYSRHSLYTVTSISEQDKSLFDGMNKANKYLECNSVVIYMNAGDVFHPDINQIEFIDSLIRFAASETEIMLMRAECKYKSCSWLMPPLSVDCKSKMISWLRTNTPVHQAVFFKYSTDKPLVYPDSYSIQADTYLIYEILTRNNYDFHFINQPCCIFELGGLSNVYTSISKTLRQTKEQLYIYKMRKEPYLHYITLPIIMFAKYIASSLMGAQFHILHSKLNRMRHK